MEQYLCTYTVLHVYICANDKCILHHLFDMGYVG